MYLQLPSYFNIKMEQRKFNSRGVGNSDQSPLRQKVQAKYKKYMLEVTEELMKL